MTMGGAEVTVETRAGTAYTVDVTAGRHELVADEPLAVGGDDEGPGPYELLLSALGSCTAMTVGMYARRKGWPLEGVRVRLTRDRPAPGPASGEGDGPPRDRIRQEIALRGPLDAAQRERLLTIAGRCAVRRTLMGTPVIEETLVEERADAVPGG